MGRGGSQNLSHPCQTTKPRQKGVPFQPSPSIPIAIFDGFRFTLPFLRFTSSGDCERIRHWSQKTCFLTPITINHQYVTKWHSCDF
jgi:hypothetical protein